MSTLTLVLITTAIFSSPFLLGFVVLCVLSYREGELLSFLVKFVRFAISTVVTLFVAGVALHVLFELILYPAVRLLIEFVLS